MKVLLMYALLAVTAAKPQNVRPQNRLVVDTDRIPERQWTAADLTPEPRPEPPAPDFENTNPEFTHDGNQLFESDMVLTAEQRDGRQAVTSLWPGGQVSFAISSSSSGDRAAILAGINHWRDNTCIQFTEVAEGSSVPHINVIKGSGCWSYVGKITNAGGQDLSIGDGCTSLGTVAHELGHAMGLYHQQSRHDRDTYVTILTDNIKDGKAHNFKKLSTPNNYSVPYDLTSMMHYGRFYFSKNRTLGLLTIRVKDFVLDDRQLIGSRGGMSHRDKQITNAMYNCDDSCASKPTCQNGGFVDKSCTCVCPPNTSGTNCETLNRSYYGDIDCGDLDITAEGTITTPNYPGKFPTNVVCWWVITAPTGKRVNVSITDMKMLYRYSDGVCHWDYMTLRYTGDVYTDDKKACDSELQGQDFTSTGNQFIIKFRSDRYGWYRGFSADVKFVA